MPNDSSRSIRTRRGFLTATGAAGVVALAGCSSGDSDNGNQSGNGGGDGTVSFILNPAQADVNIQLQYEPFVEYINNNTDVTVESTRAASYTATIQEIRRGAGDLADTGPFGAVAAKDVVDVVGIRKAFGAEKYFSLLTTRADSNINRLSDIEGEQIALGSRLSTSGTLFPLKMLKDAGLDIGDAPEGSANDFTVAGYTDHSTARDQLINRPEIVAAGTGAFSTAPHIPKSQFDSMSQEFTEISPDYEDAGTTSPQLDLLSVSDPIPRAPIVARSDWSSPARETVEETMINAPDEAFKHDPAALADELGVSQDSQKFADHQIWFSDVIDASFDDFSSVEKVLNDLGVDPAELG